MAVKEPVRFYFSFRSPYSWLAFLRIDQAIEKLPVELQYLPVFPPPDFPNDPTAVPNKLKYIRQDITRIADAYGYATADSLPTDCEWIRPHAAFMYAQDQGKAKPFSMAMYAARFSRGLDLGQDAVMREVAEACDLDADALLAAANDAAHQTRVVQGMIRGAQEDSIFGVPYFVYRGETFWGNDRVEWLVRAIRRAHGMPVVDLSRDLLAPLDR
jgi:2-hydroxychromene-2-carboxylate isomerase